MAFRPTPNSAAGPSTNSDLNHAVMPPNIPVMNPWSQTPPSVMPWSIENRPDLVRFGESFEETENLKVPSPKVRCYKRKSDMDLNMYYPEKTHLVDEDFLDKMHHLNINNSVCEQVLEDVLDDASNCSTCRLILSDEVKTFLSNYPEQKSSVSKINNSTTALVLWRPPAISFKDLLSRVEKNKE